MTDTMSQVRRHYAREEIVDKALTALKGQGKGIDRLTVEDLAPLDQMHLRGIEETRDLAQQAGMGEGDRVLDLGSGLGGTARTFAAEFGCRVVGLDLTPEYVEAAEAFTHRLGLEDQVEFRQGDATHLPFDDDSFDFVTSMAVFMNIPDKKTVYQEIRRVLRPGGRLAQVEVMKGPDGTLQFPVLWATDPSFSFLETPEQVRGHLEDVGFKEVVWKNNDKPALEWAHELQKKMKEQGPAAVGPHVIHGPDIGERMMNSIQALAQGTITGALIVMEVPKTG